MLTWDNFAWFAGGSVGCWIVAAVLAYRKGRGRAATAVFFAGILLFGCFIAGLWRTLERPPLRTMGETRLFYSWFVACVGWVVYIRWRYAWLLSISTVLSAVFIGINILRPEIHDKALMPALQSAWFVPHVIVYMFAYALLGCALLIGGYSFLKRGRPKQSPLFGVADNLVYSGVALLTLGMMFGAIWAKQAWGHYWGWDPKETWAAVTWLTYLMYMHVRFRYPEKYQWAWGLLVLAFLFLQICWYGVSYLPSASTSVHVYT